MSPPRVRFAPSPTGYLHIGGVRTALFNWLYARHLGGTFVLRIEDTDQGRSTPESLKAILDGLRWVGLDWDEGPDKGGKFGPYFQMQRMKRYHEASEQLIAAGKAFRCYCKKEELDVLRKQAEKEKRTFLYPGTCRNRTDAPSGPHVVRLRKPDGERQVGFTDLVLGEISKPLSDLDDVVLLRTDGIPLYNFGCVLDDHDMEISVVGRGQEHVNSTFPQLLLYEAFGWTPPQFAHFPLILASSKEKLSKRKHPEADVMLHKQVGILPEALLNFVVRLGWSHGDDEVISKQQMIEWFDFSHVGRTSGVWNPEKLQWLNQQYFKTLPPSKVAAELAPYVVAAGATEAVADAKLEKIVTVLRDRAKTLTEMAASAKYFYGHGVTLDPAAVTKHFTPEGKKALAATCAQLGALTAWSAAPIDAVVKAVAETEGLGMGKVAQPLRVAVTGGAVSPGIGDTLEIIGRDETLFRINRSLGATP